MAEHEIDRYETHNKDDSMHNSTAVTVSTHRDTGTVSMSKTVLDQRAAFMSEWLIWTA